MATFIKDFSIFELAPLAKNLKIKESVYVEENLTASTALSSTKLAQSQQQQNQTICLVTEDNELIFHSTCKNSNPSKVTIKIVSWFKNASKSIQNVCFDPSGMMLLVLCYDNTLHTVPVSWILYQTPISDDFHLAHEKITSFIVPFAGPHECPNSKTCPNNNNKNTELRSNSNDGSLSMIMNGQTNATTSTTAEYVEECCFSTYELLDDLSGLYGSFFADANRNPTSTLSIGTSSIDSIDQHCYSSSQSANKHSDNGKESLYKSPCPYPTVVIWWQTIDMKNCAIIGYSDGSICFVELRPNCPLIASTNILNGGIAKMFICRDYTMNNVTLMINSTVKEQWKLLLEQKSIGYIYPGNENTSTTSTHTTRKTNQSKEFASKSIEDDWQIVIPLDDVNVQKDDDEQFQRIGDDLIKSKELVLDNLASLQSQSSRGLLPVARARLASLRDLGAKKIGALKLKLVESKLRSSEKERIKEQMTTFAIMDEPATSPEILTTPSGPFFILQYIKGTHLLSALHTYSDTLSVHSMNISLIPMFIYKIPKKCQSIVLTSTFMFTVQEYEDRESVDAESVGNNAVGVVSCNTTTLQIGEDSEFNTSSLFALFKLPNERILNIHRVSCSDIEATRDYNVEYQEIVNGKLNDNNSHDSPTQQYCDNRNMFNQHQIDYDGDIRKLMQTEFPKIEMDKCLVVTDKNLYIIQIKEPPHITFYNMAKQEQWALCEEFCKIFNINFSQCIEYVGDVLLKQKRTTEALLAYNVARIPPVKTALKLAMHGENGALMHLCAMALKIVYILKSKYPINHYVDYLKETPEYQHSQQLIVLKKEAKKSMTKLKHELNHGTATSDFSYGKDEAGSNLNLSNASQFHLSNLLLLTLAEKTIKEKQFLPLWNFLVINKIYHTKMTSVVLCQSGLYYSALLLACARGAHLDAFCGLVGIFSQEYGWYSELNKILFNISDQMFMECILYLPMLAIEYFHVIQTKIDKIDQKCLEKLKIQLDPFDPIYRPVVNQLLANSNDTDNEIADFCKLLIETFLIISIKLYAMKTLDDNFRNGLNSIYVFHEEDQFAINVENCSPISTGFSHCACVIDGAVYLWGSNGINCALSNTISQDSTATSSATDTFNSPTKLQFIADLGLEVHAVKCGCLHTLILTNNGLYAMGGNNLGQLGLGKCTAQALQPMLVREFDGKNISMIECGQYHSAVVADGSLYTWGWGIHGQLGHGSVENFYRPHVVEFFANKSIKQLSLGHAHTLVLCGKANGDTTLYVFGSNHFGQLGVGQQYSHNRYCHLLQSDQNHSDILHDNNTSSCSSSSFLKSLHPIELSLDQNIRLIHTKFFTNLVVTQNNRLYTWGASSQALRLQNQAKKRAKASQKKEEQSKDGAQPFNNEKSTNTQKKTCDDQSINQTMRHNDTDAKDNSELSNCYGNILKSTCRSKSMNDLSSSIVNVESNLTNHSSNNESSNNNTSSSSGNQLVKGESFEEESTDHLLPSVVDTIDVVGNIMQLSTGLYHYALITDKCHLYTWGKNFEKQIGRDSARKECIIPTLLETIENPIFVECGADFTLVMTMDYTVKAFGSNSYGQCGRDINAEKTSTASKLVMLRISKRVVRIPDSSQCFEMPVNVNLPRPKIKMDFDPVRYLKSLPKFRRRFIVRTRLGLPLELIEKPSYTNTIESNILNMLGDSGLNGKQGGQDAIYASELNQNVIVNIRGSSNIGGDDDDDDDDDDDEETHNTQNTTVDDCNDLFSNDFLHYCLFIFHGTYQPLKLIDFTSRKEFKVRILLLNYRITEAFSLCISDAQSARDAIAIFEYFTKDSGIIPIHREDLKFLIYELFMMFLNNNLNIGDIEEFLIADLDYYLLAIAYVLYFSNNNTELERQVSAKYSHLFGDGEQQLRCLPQTLLLHTELIFKAVSIAFKARICQRLLDYDSNFN